MLSLKTNGLKLINHLIDVFIVLYLKGRFWMVIAYYYYIHFFRPNTKIIYASTKINNSRRDVLPELITFYDYDLILSCASLQRWFREKYNLKVSNIKFIYLENGKPILRRYNLDEDEGLSKKISFKGELEYSNYGSVSILD